MSHVDVLEPGQTYHIFNRGNNRENLFYSDRHYKYFLKLYSRYILPAADTYANCLMGNHFHLLVRIKEAEEIVSMKSQVELPNPSTSSASKNFSNLFNAYTKSINIERNRTGSLFEKSFKRKLIKNDAYFQQLIIYIHTNPQKHGFVEDFREWDWSSYHAISEVVDTKLHREEVLAWFGGVNELISCHLEKLDESKIANLIDDDY